MVTEGVRRSGAVRHFHGLNNGWRLNNVGAETGALPRVLHPGQRMCRVPVFR